jgi:hypothetical protein
VLRFVSLPRFAVLALALLAAAPSAQAFVLYRYCGVEIAPGFCNYHVDVDVDPDSGSASAGMGVCGEQEPVWRADADVDPDGDGGTVWVPMSAPSDGDGPSRRESYGSDCDDKERESPAPTGIHQRVYV